MLLTTAASTATRITLVGRERCKVSNDTIKNWSFGRREVPHMLSKGMA